MSTATIVGIIIGVIGGIIYRTVEYVNKRERNKHNKSFEQQLHEQREYNKGISNLATALRNINK